MPKNLSFVKYVEEMPSGNGLFSVFITAFLRFKRFRRIDFTLNHLKILPNFYDFWLIWPLIDIFMIFRTCQCRNPRTTGLLPFGNMTHNCWVIKKKSCFYILFVKSLLNLYFFKISVLALGGSLWYRHLSLMLIKFQTDRRTLKCRLKYEEFNSKQNDYNDFLLKVLERFYKNFNFLKNLEFC